MELIAFVGEDAQQEALKAARGITLRDLSRTKGLPAPIGDAVMRWVDEAWDQAEQALRNALHEGRAAAQASVEAMHQIVARARVELGARVKEVEALLQARLDEYMRNQVSLAFGRLQSEVQVGDVKLRATAADIQQTVKMSGSLKAKLDEICDFVAEGEIGVKVSYGILQS